MPTDSRRDPRIDPKVGDILDNGLRTREVVRVAVNRHGATIVKYTAKVTGNTAKRWRRRVNCAFLPAWRQWARNAEVIESASQEGTDAR